MIFAYLPEGRDEKKKKPKQPSRPQATILRQLVELIPAYLVPQLARETGADKQARTFTPWSHVVTMLFAQVSHAFGLNDVCDALGLWVTPLRALRGATPPSRNNLSHANKTRDCALAEKLFWRMLAHLQTLHPGFARGGQHSLAWRFRRAIHIVRRHDHQTRGQLHRLGAPPPPQGRLRWTPKVGHRGSLTQTQENDPHVEETSSAQCPVQSPGRA